MFNRIIRLIPGAAWARTDEMRERFRLQAARVELSLSRPAPQARHRLPPLGREIYLDDVGRERDQSGQGSHKISVIQRLGGVGGRRRGSLKSGEILGFEAEDNGSSCTTPCTNAKPPAI